MVQKRIMTQNSQYIGGPFKNSYIWLCKPDVIMSPVNIIRARSQNGFLSCLILDTITRGFIKFYTLDYRIFVPCMLSSNFHT